MAMLRYAMIMMMMLLYGDHTNNGTPSFPLPGLGWQSLACDFVIGRCVGVEA